jgi:hypothetical protein
MQRGRLPSRPFLPGLQQLGARFIRHIDGRCPCLSPDVGVNPTRQHVAHSRHAESGLDEVVREVVAALPEGCMLVVAVRVGDRKKEIRGLAHSTLEACIGAAIPLIDRSE